MAEDEVWKDARKFTFKVFRDFGMGKNSIENYVDIELQSFIQTIEVFIQFYDMFI